MKTCSKCKQSKPAASFYRDKSKPDGLRPDCRSCVSLQRKEFYKENKDAYLVRNAKYRAIYGVRDEVQRHGITLAEYEQMLLSQDGKCYICHRPPVPSKKGRDTRLCVDHDHSCCPGTYSCGKCIRKLLCGPCNRGLGGFRDDVHVMERAVQYLYEK